MNEIEVKILGHSHEQLLPKLQSLGAKKVFEGELFAILFDSSQSTLKNSGITLRLRKEGNKSVLCTKTKLESDNVKSQHEVEVEVSDFEETRTILRVLGYKEVFTLQKSRVSYKLLDGKIEFDTYTGENAFVPPFFEVEAENEDSVFKIVEILGFKKSDCKNWSSREVIQYYKNLK